MQFKCDVTNGSIQNGLKNSKLFTFVLDKPPGYNITSEPETIQYKKNKICFENYNILLRR